LAQNISIGFSLGLKRSGGKIVETLASCASGLRWCQIWR
jgi:hypothetical protein